MGDGAAAKGFPTLLESLTEDLRTVQFCDNVILAVTGDITETNSLLEYHQAQKLFEKLADETFGTKKLTKDRVFIVPGNHDVAWDQPLETKFSNYGWFYNQFFSQEKRAINPYDHVTSSRVFDLAEDCGVLILEINSAAYVEKGKPGSLRGELDFATIKKIKSELAQIEKERIRKCIKIALVHHHPVLLPALAEPGRGYDAIQNSASLLRALRQFGFQLILHGHKHYPYAFTYDPECPWVSEEKATMAIIAGGSVGTSVLPAGKSSQNTYNIITVKWNHETEETGIWVETRGLNVDLGGEIADPDEWKWELIQGKRKSIFLSKRFFKKSDFSAEEIVSDEGYRETDRSDVYKKFHGNMPIVEVVMSDRQDQEYCAHFRIERHPDKPGRKSRYIEPEYVIWSAGELFEVFKCEPATNPNFSGCFHFYGSMLLQATMKFPKEKEEQCAYVYAFIPRITVDSKTDSKVTSVLIVEERPEDAERKPKLALGKSKHRKKKAR